MTICLDEIETTVHNSLEREVSSVKIGEMVMDRLRKIDERYHMFGLRPFINSLRILTRLKQSLKS